MQTYGWLLDPKRCVECRACEVACKQWNQVPTGLRYRLVRIHENTAGNVLALPGACNHCDNAWCMKVCPARAITRDAHGAVQIDTTKCFGCRQCYAFCPYEAPQWNEAKRVMQKCTMCADRLEAGEQPACATLCPTGAIRFGKWEEIQGKGSARIDHFSNPAGTRPRARFIVEGFPG